MLEQFDNQRNRGVNGFGLFNGKHLFKAAEEDRILNWLCKDKNDSDLLLFHHRFPTSTVNVRRAAHPFTTKDYFGDTEYILVHNGIISNPEKLFEKHQEQGIEYVSMLDDLSYNDSEALAWDFALTMEGKQEKMQAYGQIAFVCMKLVKGKVDKLYFARNSRPLNMLRDKTGIMLSSEGEGEPIDPDKLYTYNYKLKRLTKHYMKFKQWDTPVYDTSRYNYRSGVYQPSGYPYRTSACGYNQDGYEHTQGRLAAYSQPVTPRSWNGYDYNESEEEVETWDNQAYEDWCRANNYGTEWVEGIEVVYSTTLNRYVAKNPEDNQRLSKLDSLKPSDSDVKSLAEEYLMASAGHFQSAMTAMEDDYYALWDDIEDSFSDDMLENQLLLEASMKYLDDDPEFENESSISSVMEAKWHTNQQQQQLLGA